MAGRGLRFDSHSQAAGSTQVPLRRDTPGQQRLRDEAENRRLCSWGPPKIVHLEDLKCLDGRRSFVMQHVKDGNLADTAMNTDPKLRIRSAEPPEEKSARPSPSCLA